ncbi:hypothetical protein PSAB6_450064 [Paraburkholderia sabiae]|nr:hypothetical protein PSAB6_450064 [Paraburkholderia sabiae]
MVPVLFFGFSVFGFCFGLASANSYLCFMQKKAAFEPPVPARITLPRAAVELLRSDANTP